MKLLIALSALLAAATPAAGQPGFVRVNGKELIGVNGKPLLLRGINLGNWFVPEGYMFRFDHGPQSGREIDALFRDLAGPRPPTGSGASGVTATFRKAIST